MATRRAVPARIFGTNFALGLKPRLDALAEAPTPREKLFWDRKEPRDLSQEPQTRYREEDYFL